jgi:phosphohistidine phosphatase
VGSGGAFKLFLKFQAMKYLFIIRHAKSSWDNPFTKDFERPLNERGEKSIAVMGKFLKINDENFDIVISSPAKRAITTASGICNFIHYKTESIQVDNTIYHASSFQLFKTITGISDQYETAALFGHNPGLTDLCNYLTEDYISNLPTCGIVKIRFDIDSWSEVSKGNGKTIYLETPKKHGMDTDD